MLKPSLPRFLWTISLLFFFVCTPVSAEQISKEYQIKAAIIIKLVQFFQWEDSSSPIKFCLLQPDSFSDFIDGVANNRKLKPKDRLLVIQRIDNTSNDVASCNVLFVSELSGPLTQTYPENTLLISDNGLLTNSSFHLNIFLKNSQVKFEANIDNIKQSKISINPMLLKVAKLVKND